MYVSNYVKVDLVINDLTIPKRNCGREMQYIYRNVILKI